MWELGVPILHKFKNLSIALQLTLYIHVACIYLKKKKLPISGLTQLTCVVQKLNQLSQQLNDLCFSENDFISFGIIIAYSSGFTPKV